MKNIGMNPVSVIGNGMGDLGDIGIGLNITRYRYRISVSVSVYRYRSNSNCSVRNTKNGVKNLN